MARVEAAQPARRHARTDGGMSRSLEGARDGFAVKGIGPRDIEQPERGGGGIISDDGRGDFEILFDALAQTTHGMSMSSGMLRPWVLSCPP